MLPRVGILRRRDVARSGRSAGSTAISRNLAASIRAGRMSAAHALHRLGSAAVGDPLHRAAEHLGCLLRTLFLCDYLALPDYRREIHTLLAQPGRVGASAADMPNPL